MTMHDLCRQDELAVGEKKLFKVAGEDILLFHLDDGFYATQAKCTHLFKSMAKGKVVDDSRIMCPLHRAQFDIRTGQVHEWACFPPGVIKVINAVRSEKDLKTYAVSQQGGMIQVEVEEAAMA